VCSALQCTTVCCSVLQCVAVCCSVLQCVAVCCSVLQCVATHYICRAQLEFVREYCWVDSFVLEMMHRVAAHCNKVQHTATHWVDRFVLRKMYSVLQHTGKHCMTLHDAATHCNTLGCGKKTSLDSVFVSMCVCMCLCASVCVCMYLNECV